MLTRYISVLLNPNNGMTEGHEKDVWADFCTAVGCDSQASTIEELDARTEEGIKAGFLDPQWRGASVVKITIEEIQRPCDNLSTCGEAENPAKS